MQNTEKKNQLHLNECAEITHIIDNYFEPAQFAVGENPIDHNVSEDCLFMIEDSTSSVVVQETSYANLRHLNSRPVPSQVLTDRALSVESFSLVLDLSKNDKEQQSSNEMLLQAMTDIVDIIKLEPPLPRSNLGLCKMPPLVPIKENAEMIPQYCPIPIEEDLLESPTNVILSSETKLLLSEQMRKHVQLLTQMHLFTAQQSALTYVTEECRSMLKDLIPFRQKMNIANLDEALDLVTHWENIVSKTDSQEFCRYQRPADVNFGGERKDPYYLFNLELVEMMGESRVFMYPELLPKLAIHQTEPGTDLRFSPYEDQLIAMGIEQFTPFCTNLSNDWWYPLDFLVSSMISKHMLPQWSAEQIQIRIMNNCLDTSPANPIKYYQENRVAPTIEHVIRPFHSTSKLRNVSPSLLPDHWRKLLVKSTVRMPSPVQFPVNHLLCFASITSFSGTYPLSKVFPARIVNSRAFAGVPELIFSSSRIPSLPHRQPLASIPFHQQRHKPVCKRRIFLQEFSTEV